MANADNEDIVMDIEEIEDGEIKDSQEVYVILSETDGEDEPEGVDSYGRVKRPRPNDSASSLSAITKNVTLGSLLAIDRSRPNTNNTSTSPSRSTVVTRKVTRGNLTDHGRQWELGDRTRTIRPYNKVWGSQIFNNRDRNKPALTPGVQSRRKRNDIWGSSLEGSRQEAIQRKRKAERSKPKRRSKSKEYDTLLREYREVQRAIRAEEARQNADSNHRTSSVRRSLPRRHSRLSSVAKTTQKQRPKSRSTVTSVENSKDVDSKSKQDGNSKPKEDANSKPKQDEEDDEMTELELRRLALVSASKKVSVKGANDSPSDSLNSESRVTRQPSSKEETATPANSQPVEQDNYEEVAMEVEDDTAGAQNTEKRSSPVTERPKSTSQKNSTSAKEEEEDDDEIEELALRAELLKTMASKKNAVLTNQEGATSDTSSTTKVVNSPKSQESVATESPKTQSRRSSPYQERTYTYQPTRIARQPVIPPTHGPLVITVNGDSDSSDEEPTADDQVKQFLRQFRNPPQQSKESPTVEDHAKVKDKVVTKTPEALNKLPETHVAEYRRLKEEIARREQRKETKKGNAFEQNEIKLKRIAALEAKLSRNRSTMEKNYRMYQESARQQSEKQRNMQKALFRIQKLREQIAVMEKVVVLNRNLMKKYSDEQKSRLLTLEGCLPVENEVREELMVLRETKVEEFELVATVKQLRDEQTEMTKNRMQTGLQEKSTKMSKAVRKQANELHRLKKLEEEYALKIKRYREAQAKAGNQPTATSEHIREKKVEANIRPAVSIYKKDKIPFSSSNTPTQTDSETEKENVDKDDSGDNARRKRRRSWLDDNSSLTPQLSAKLKKVTHVTKFKDRFNSNRKERNNLVEPQLVERNLLEPPQSVAEEKSDGVNNCDKGIHQSARGDYLHPSNYFMKEFLSGRRRKRSILKVHLEAADEGAQAIKFGKYISPLLCFKAYRLHEAYWKAAGLSPFSKTVSNKVDPRRVLCKFELNGVCNDSSCRCLHERDYLLSDEAILADFLSYAPSLVNVTPKMTPKEQSQKIQRFLQSVKEQVNKENTNHPTKDEARFCLKSVVRQLKKEKIECPVLCERQWIPKNKDSVNQTKSKQEDVEEEEDTYFQVFRASKDPEGIKIVGVDDNRYYSSENKDIEALESLVLEEPNEIHHWLKLVNLIKRNSSAQSQDRALNALSRGLEHNPSSSELWLLYLSLYSSRPEHPDLAEICSQAMDYCKEYNVHWKCLEVAESYDTKLSTCQDILQFLTSDPSKREEERTSNEILETLLYQTQLHILTGQVKEACQLLKDVLSATSNDDDEDGAVLRFLTRSDTCLLWVIYIHLESFQSLPQCLFEDNGCGLGHVIKKSHFICPWHQPLVRSLDEVIALFDAASKSVKEDSFHICSVLYHNWIALLSLSNRKQEAVDLCRHILDKHPEERSVWRTLLALEMKRSEDIIKVREVYYEAFSKCPPSPQLYFTAAKIENSEGFPAEAVTILSDSAAAFFELPPEGVSHEYTCNLFRILLHQPVPISFKSPPMQTKFQPIIEDSQAYIWLCFCFLLTLKPVSSDEEGLNPKNAFELAISFLPSGEGLLDVCLQYFQYQLWRSGPTVEEKGRTLRQVIKSIIATRPSSFPFPFTEDCVYVDYSFHNSVLDIYLEHLQPECLTEAYEDYISLMPQNLGLLQKFIDYLWKGEAYHYIKFLAKSALAIHPKSLFLWNVLLQATEKTGDVKEVAYLSSEAARALPIIPHLWRHSNKKVDLPGVSEKTSDELATT